jgi:hypothetical protein
MKELNPDEMGVEMWCKLGVNVNVNVNVNVMWVWMGCKCQRDVSANGM